MLWILWWSVTACTLHGAPALQSEVSWAFPVARFDLSILTTNQSEDVALQVLQPASNLGPLGILGRNEGGYFWLVLDEGQPVRTNRLSVPDLRNAALAEDGTLTVLVLDRVPSGSSGAGADGIQALRFAPTGEKMWSSDRLRMDEGQPTLLRLRGRDGIWVAGSRKNSGSNPAPLEVTRLDGDGHVVWSQSPSLSPSVFQALQDFAVDANGEAVLIGSAIRNGLPDWFVVRLNSAGQPQWVRFMDGVEGGVTAGAISYDFGSQVVLTSAGEIVVAGFSSSTSPQPAGPRSADLAAPAVVGSWTSDGTLRWLTQIPLAAQSMNGLALAAGGAGDSWLGTVSYSDSGLVTSLTRVDQGGAVVGTVPVMWTNRAGWEGSTLEVGPDGEVDWGGTVWATISRTPIPNDFAANTGLMHFSAEGSLAWRQEWSNWPDLNEARREISAQGTVFGRMKANTLLVLRQTRPELDRGWDLEWHVVDATGKVTESRQVDVGAPWSRFSNPIALIPLGTNDVAYLEVEILSSLKSEPPNEVSWRITRLGADGERVWSYRHPVTALSVSTYDFSAPAVTAEGDLVVSRVIGFGEDAVLEVTRLEGATGTVSWTRALPWPNPTWAPSVAIDALRRVGVATGIQDPVNQNAVRMVLLQSQGDTAWTQTLLAGQSERRDVWLGASVAEGFYVGTGNPSSSTAARVAFVDATGAQRWSQEIRGSGTYDARVTDSTGHLYITSGLQAAIGQSDWVTRKLNSQGQFLGTNTLVKPTQADLTDASQSGRILLGSEGWFVVSSSADRESLMASGRVRYGDWEITRERLANSTVLEWFHAEPEDVSELHFTAASARTGFVAAQLSGEDRPYTYLFRLNFNPGIVLEAGLTRVHTWGEPGKLHVCRRATSLAGPWERVAEVRASMLGDLKISEPTQSRSRAFYQFEPVP